MAHAIALTRVTKQFNGTLAVDRRRGWLVSSRTMIVVHSIMTPPPTRGEPLHFRMRITQWTRTAEK